MNLKQRIYTIFSKLVPFAYRKHLKEQLMYAGIKEAVEGWLGSATLLSFLLFLIVVFMPYTLYQRFELLYLLIGIGVFLLIEFSFYILLYFKVEDRTKRIEEVLPDALQLISANLRAGMAPYQALKLSARKEFGPFKEEIEHATALALGTESFSEVLLGIGKRVKSDMLERALNLFTTAMRSGGHLAQLLEELSRDIAETRSLKKELVTNTRTYVMFIMFTIVIGTPLLLAIAIHFVDVITGIQEAGPTGAGFGMAFLAGEITITADFLIKVSVVLLAVTSVLAAMLMGVIQEGKSKYGLKYAPFVMIGSFAVFFIVRHFIGSFLG